MDTVTSRIRIAIQKTGRLSDESFKLLNHCGIQLRPRKEQLFCHSDNFPLDLLLVRDDDIPNLVADGICDYGILGTNLLQEKSLQSKALNIEIARTLNFAICRLAIAVPKNSPYRDISSLSQCRIATTYPNILADFMRKKKLFFEIIPFSGSVEVAPRLGIADGICDLVSTGATLEANNLREVETVFKSQAVLIKSKKPLAKEKIKTANLFQCRVEGAELARGSKYIMLHAPKSALVNIVKLLPGTERPTIQKLQGDISKVAVHALCHESIFWETMEQLKRAGASSILVLPVEKMMK